MKKTIIIALLSSNVIASTYSIPNMSKVFHGDYVTTFNKLIIDSNSAKSSLRPRTVLTTSLSFSILDSQSNILCNVIIEKKQKVISITNTKVYSLISKNVKVDNEDAHEDCTIYNEINNLSVSKFLTKEILEKELVPMIEADISINVEEIYNGLYSMNDSESGSLITISDSLGNSFLNNRVFNAFPSLSNNLELAAEYYTASTSGLYNLSDSNSVEYYSINFEFSNENISKIEKKIVKELSSIY